jgi:hypothetical protein
MTTMHTLHGYTHEVGLQPGCPRCEEHAAAPLAGLDRENLRRLLNGRRYTTLDEVAGYTLDDIRKKAAYLERVAAGEEG